MNSPALQGGVLMNPYKRGFNPFCSLNDITLSQKVVSAPFSFFPEQLSENH